MTNEQKISRIIEWLYINDHNCSSAKDWKQKLIAELKEVLGGSQYVHYLGGSNITNGNYPDNNFTSPCSCGTSVKCPIHNLLNSHRG